MSVAAYEEQQQRMEELELRAAVRTGQADIDAGRVHDHDDVMRELEEMVAELAPAKRKSSRRTRK